MERWLQRLLQETMASQRFEIRQRPSPNHGERRDGAGVDMLILHYTGMDSAEGACERLCDPASEVSAHYLVDEVGLITAMVHEERRAWHAGVASWRGRRDINSASVGIEIANPGDVPFPERQMAAVAWLCKGVLERHAVPRRYVLGHSDIAPGRKIDPGERFDWRGLAGQGIGLWPGETQMRGRAMREGDHGEDVERFQAALATFGYGLVADGRYGAETARVVAAFQRHFRPARIDGQADAQTRDLVAGVLAACVDQA
ncbi:MAG: peptidoglycan recognition protein family protein [Alphaproteobacteria bacterium]|jgi:N-acetylmuramoyl-L-alanine amidase